MDPISIIAIGAVALLGYSSVVAGQGQQQNAVGGGGTSITYTNFNYSPSTTTLYGLSNIGNTSNPFGSSGAEASSAPSQPGGSSDVFGNSSINPQSQILLSPGSAPMSYNSGGSNASRGYTQVQPGIFVPNGGGQAITPSTIITTPNSNLFNNMSVPSGSSLNSSGFGNPSTPGKGVLQASTAKGGLFGQGGFLGTGFF